MTQSKPDNSKSWNEEILQWEGYPEPEYELEFDRDFCIDYDRDPFSSEEEVHENS